MGHPGHGVPGLACCPQPVQTKGKTMKLKLLSILALSAMPMAALAMPAVGDLVGTNPETAKAALEKAGCTVNAFEAEDGKIEAKCTDTATKLAMEVYIDPASGKVTDIKSED
jgi:Peptidase propeptide and YPEB domain